jgi:hypothetical protein
MSAPVDPYLEVAGLMKKLDGGPALLFAKVNGHDMPVIGNLLSCQANCRGRLRRDFRGIREFVGRALGEPKPPVLVENAPAQEQVHPRTSISAPCCRRCITPPTMPAAIITAGIVIARDPDTGVYNASYHRLMLAGPNRVAIQLDFGRHLRARIRARAEKRPASAGRGLHRHRPGAALHRGDDGLADAGECRRARRRRRPVRPAAAGGEGDLAGSAGAGRERDRAWKALLKCDEQSWKARSASSSAIWRPPIQGRCSRSRR